MKQGKFNKKKSRTSARTEPRFLFNVKLSHEEHALFARKAKNKKHQGNISALIRDAVKKYPVSK